MKKIKYSKLWVHTSQAYMKRELVSAIKRDFAFHQPD
ncbi:hypothetical protein SAMN05421863_102239 [Nitrosomonas communis]|uniref:Uncharacterized protein n=1 Tax=Nitrosomonas communis TaxID=44574 RepID=A0A1I4PR50_9PROT|nr:hypothetical protein SAMN05421863_102239 [Nitrosomonas communis]